MKVGKWSGTLFSICLMLGGLSMLIGRAWGGAVPDTGQHQCFDENGIMNPCPQVGMKFYGQDASYSIHPSSYTKLGANDISLPDSATFADGWMATRDNITGLIWEVKTDDGGVHDKDNTYAWCDTVGGVQASCSSGTDTGAFIQAVNQANYAGHSDWRLPTPQELQTLVNYGKFKPAIDLIFFPNIKGGFYWSAMKAAGNVERAWGVDYHDGYVYSEIPSTGGGVICVRGESAAFSPDAMQVVGNGTIIDAGFGLSWQQEDGQVKEWEQALAYCQELVLGGEEDWRLPTVKELGTLVDYGKCNSASRVNLSSLVEPSFAFWSATPDASSVGLAWYVDFTCGEVASTAFSPLRVRCVRSTTTSKAVTTTGGVVTTSSTTLAPSSSTTTSKAVTTTGGVVTTSSTTILPTPPVPTQQQIALSVGSGWSLLSSSITFQVATVLGDSKKITSVWKWENGSWSVYLPGEANQGSYAKGKGFGMLTSVNSGEGFWVNSISSMKAMIPGIPVYGALSFSHGWNLVGLKSDQAVPVSNLVSGQGITSLWAWQGGSWAVYLPGEQDSGQGYAQSKGFSVLSTLNPGEGFWVNKP